MQRRRFLHVAVAAFGALTVPLVGCAGEAELPLPSEDALAAFPQGVASGDPHPDSVILWTRVSPNGAAEETVHYEIGIDQAFGVVLASGDLTVDASTDFAIRVKVTGLAPRTTYYYRFRARGTTSDIGRTKTAPSPDDDVPVRFAFASCQDFVGRYYYAWRALATEPAVDFVVFLGDYVYETVGDPGFQSPSSVRSVTLPDGMPIADDPTANVTASTLADYRALYRQYRSDPDLRRVHQLYPFVVVWDDHEFANDCWQDHATDWLGEHGDEKETARRTAATRAFHEYQPVDVPYQDGTPFPGDTQIYRSFRFGRHVELFMTDERSYRSAHVIPDGPADPAAVHFANSSVGSRVLVLKSALDVREAAARPTMLGDAQRRWLIDGIKGSTATWKIWGSEVQVAQMLTDLSSFSKVPSIWRDRFYMSADQWDGYRTERAAILSDLRGTENVVVVSGDIHSFYASELEVDFDHPVAPVAVEFVGGAVSSISIQDGTARELSSPTFESFGLGELVTRFDELLRATNPHYRYAESRANGLGVVDVRGDQSLEVTLLQVSDVLSEPWSGQVDRVRLRCSSGSSRITLAG